MIKTRATKIKNIQNEETMAITTIKIIITRVITTAIIMIMITRIKYKNIKTLK